MPTDPLASLARLLLSPIDQFVVARQNSHSAIKRLNRALGRVETIKGLLGRGSIVLEDTLELRQQLHDAWRAVLDGAVGRGCPPEAVIETMTSVAHERFSELFGPHATASYLQLLAEQLREGERRETVSLVGGRDPKPAPLAQEILFDSNWITEEPLL